MSNLRDILPIGTAFDHHYYTCTKCDTPEDGEYRLCPQGQKLWDAWIQAHRDYMRDYKARQVATTEGGAQ